MKKINLLFSLLIAGVFALGQNALTLTAVTDFTTPAYGNSGESVVPIPSAGPGSRAQRDYPVSSHWQPGSNGH